MAMADLAMIGCGYVADYYMRSLATMPKVRLGGVHDRDAVRMACFAAHWNVTPTDSIDAALATLRPGGIVLNLTNPGEHFAVSKTCLEAGFHVYSEKPLAMQMEDATALHALAAERGLMLSSAPCSVLGEAAQTLWAAIRGGVAGTPRLIYAELDDDFIPQAPHQKWLSEAGAPWPAADEFRVGCTLEHAGYYLTWLIAIFGAVETVVAASAETIPDKLPGEETAPDFSVATLFFEGGMVARLTCSITAPHDHRLRVVGDRGVLSLDKAWDNAAPVRFRRRLTIRRRLINHPFARRVRLAGASHPKVKGHMNFMLGPKEMLDAEAEGRPCRLSSDFALHLNEVTLAIQTAGRNTGAQQMTTRCAPFEPMDWAVLA